MPLPRLQKIALGALISVIFLMFVGATVRVTGSGMGCPDWPLCWGKLIPPTNLSQINFEKLPIEKFQKRANREAERHGHPPHQITRQSLHNEFHASHAWTEYFNRLCSLPVGIFTLLFFLGSFRYRSSHPLLFFTAFASIILVLTNAWMGARIVHSGLNPGVITIHLALAMLLLGALVYGSWRCSNSPWTLHLPREKRKNLRIWLTCLFLCTIAEGIMGSQIREMTDTLAKLHHGASRTSWTHELEQTTLYLVHRSFSWFVLLFSAGIWFTLRKINKNGTTSHTIFAIVLTQMLLGLIMAQVHIYAWVQVIHVGLAAVLLSLEWLMLFSLFSRHRHHSHSSNTQ